MRVVKQGDELLLYPEDAKQTKWVKENFAKPRRIKARMQGDEATGIYVQAKILPETE